MSGLEVSFDEFKKLDLKVGKVVAAEPVEGSHSLVNMTVDLGDEERQSVAGLRDYYEPDQLVGKRYVFLVNLEPATFMGVESKCMVLAAEENGDDVILIAPERDVKVGSPVK